MVLGLALIWLAVVNGGAWIAFDQDKKAAIAGRRRTPEKTLLILALAGGTPAAFLARATLRHKTRKQPFSILLYGIAILQIGLLAALATPEFRRLVVGWIA